MKSRCFSEWITTIILLWLKKVIYKRIIFLGQNAGKEGNVILVPGLRSVSVLPSKQYWIKRTSKLRIMDWNLCLYYCSLCIHLIKSMGSESEPPQGQTFHSLSNIYTCEKINIRGSHSFCWSQHCQSGLDVLGEHHLNQTTQEHLNYELF